MMERMQRGMLVLMLRRESARTTRMVCSACVVGPTDLSGERRAYGTEVTNSIITTNRMYPYCPLFGPYDE